MNKETMWEAMEHLAPDLIEEADCPAAPRRRRSWSKTLLIAAAACLVLAVGVVAADALFGFRFLSDDLLYNGGHDYSFEADLTRFPDEQFSEEVQNIMEASDPVQDSFVFDTWDEVLNFIGENIPLAPESSVLADATNTGFHVSVSKSTTNISTIYTLDGYDIIFNVHIGGEELDYFHIGSVFADETFNTQRTETSIGSGAGALIHLTTDEDSNGPCTASFLRDGIYYGLFIVDAEDTALMEEILASF